MSTLSRTQVHHTQAIKYEKMQQEEAAVRVPRGRHGGGSRGGSGACECQCHKEFNMYCCCRSPYRLKEQCFCRAPKETKETQTEMSVVSVTDHISYPKEDHRRCINGSTRTDGCDAETADIRPETL